MCIGMQATVCLGVNEKCRERERERGIEQYLQAWMNEKLEATELVFRRPRSGHLFDPIISQRWESVVVREVWLTPNDSEWIATPENANEWEKYD